MSPRLLNAARALLGWTDDDLAREAGVDRSQPAASASDAVVAALERAGVSFIEEGGEAVGVRLRPSGEAAALPIDQLNSSNDK